MKKLSIIWGIFAISFLVLGIFHGISATKSIVSFQVSEGYSSIDVKIIG